MATEQTFHLSLVITTNTSLGVSRFVSVIYLFSVWHTNKISHYNSWEKKYQFSRLYIEIPGCWNSWFILGFPDFPGGWPPCN